jgi:hypothetical protein
MDREKELLKQDLGNQEKPEEIKKFIEDAEMLGHEDIAELRRQKLAEIESKAQEISTTSESQISQVNELGGSNEELNKKTESVDQEINEIKENTKKEIETFESNEIFNENISDEALKSLKSGEDMFRALNNEGGDAVQRRIDSLSNDERQKSNILRSLEGLTQYEYLLKATPEEIKNIYYKDFEDHNSIHYIGSVLSGINSEAFKKGFFNTLNNRPNELDDTLSLKIKIIDKILTARKNNWEK